MNNDMHGKKVRRIIWGDNQQEMLTSDAAMQLTMSATYHGDRDEHWIVQSKGETEVARHNCRNISAIEWEVEDELR